MRLHIIVLLFFFVFNLTLAYSQFTPKEDFILGKWHGLMPTGFFKTTALEIEIIKASNGTFSAKTIDGYQMVMVDILYNKNTATYKGYFLLTKKNKKKKCRIVSDGKKKFVLYVKKSGSIYFSRMI